MLSKNVAAILVIGFGIFYSCKSSESNGQEERISFTNPLDISYRFCLDTPSRREAADPSIVWFKDRYFLFASKSGGYWHSQNLATWNFIETQQIPVEEYAPTAIAIDDTLFFLASSNEKSTVYKSGNPLSGEWQVAVDSLETPVWDPAFFLDEDKRLYLYWGCSNVNPLYGVEVDATNNFKFIGEKKELTYPNPAELGWEVPGDYNTLTQQAPWIEGPWVNKYKGKYYLQYSGPGTEYKSYADAVYVGETPLGPFTLQAHNPFAYRPEGFAAAAGHGSTVQDKYGNYWHIGTITISQKHMFERRLGLYPVFFDADDVMYATTKYADYPLWMPNKKISSFTEIFPEWMLLSYQKPVAVSSSVNTSDDENIVDEDIRTYWSASSGHAGEYAVIDLENESDIYALQINFAEHNTNVFGREKGLAHKYMVEYANDTTHWQLLVDKRNNTTDNSHVYIELSEKITARYIRITNVQVPDGYFALSGFRIFGKGKGNKPAETIGLVAKRKENDRRSVLLNWQKTEGATGYNISYGVAKNKLYQNYMLYSDTSATINSLSIHQSYYFTIEAFNENGITVSKEVVEVN